MLTFMLKCLAWPFIVVGFIGGFFFGAVWQGIGGGLELVEQLIRHILGGNDAT